MRGGMVILVLALAGCGENTGWNPNYSFSASRYDQYRAEREVALVQGTDPAQVIPVARPFEAPTAEAIAGQSPVPPGATPKVRKPAASQPAPSTAQETRTAAGAPMPIALPVAQSGPYPGSTPVLVRYAFEAGHAPGTAVWSRPNPATAAQAAKTCASFVTADSAQTAFLAAGGPQQDPRGMDPDGDGFVCGWDPAPFRQPQL